MSKTRKELEMIRALRAMTACISKLGIMAIRDEYAPPKNRNFPSGWPNAYTCFSLRDAAMIVERFVNRVNAARSKREPSHRQD